MPNNVKQWQTIKVEKNDSLVTVTLNRPDVRNAFHPLMIQELTELFKSVLPIDVDCRTVVLQGAGKSFCSGADLGWMQSMVDFSMSENIRDSENLFAMFKALREFPLPLVGRVHGHAMGGALGLIAVCDIVARRSGRA